MPALSNANAYTFVAMGVDPGFRYCGVSAVAATVNHSEGRLVVLDLKPLHVERIDTGKLDTPHQRLGLIASTLVDIASEHNPIALGWENIGGVRAGKESKGMGHSAAGDRMKEVPGMCRAIAAHLGSSSWAIMPASYRKLFLGAGNTKGATKEDVKRVVQRLLRLSALSNDESEACALAVAAGIEHLRCGLCLNCASASPTCCEDRWVLPPPPPKKARRSKAAKEAA